MSDHTKGWKVQVDPEFPNDPKLKRLAIMIEPDIQKLTPFQLRELVAMGTVLKLWCLTMRKEDSGSYVGWAPEDVALQCGWEGPPAESWIKAMVECGRNSTHKDNKGFLEVSKEKIVVHEWREWQNDPAGQRQKWREYRAQRREAARSKNGAPKKAGRRRGADELAKEIEKEQEGAAR